MYTFIWYWMIVWKSTFSETLVWKYSKERKGKDKKRDYLGNGTIWRLSYSLDTSNERTEGKSGKWKCHYKYVNLNWNCRFGLKRTWNQKYKEGDVNGIHDWRNIAENLEIDGLRTMKNEAKRNRQQTLPNTFVLYFVICVDSGRLFIQLRPHRIRQQKKTKWASHYIGQKNVTKN